MADPNNGALLDFGQAFRKAADYCIPQDRCLSEIQLKLKLWGIENSYIDEIIARLIRENFLNEKRFAENYARGKFRINGWGKLKIAAGLRARSIPAELIQQALLQIDTKEYILNLKSLMEKKLTQLGGNTPANRQKAAFFAASRGFEQGAIMSVGQETEYPG
jgi:regulatory protein